MTYHSAVFRIVGVSWVEVVVRFGPSCCTFQISAHPQFAVGHLLRTSVLGRKELPSLVECGNRRHTCTVSDFVFDVRCAHDLTDLWSSLHDIALIDVWKQQPSSRCILPVSCIASCLQQAVTLTVRSNLFVESHPTSNVIHACSTVAQKSHG
jgi:hypothetical protein